MSTYKLAVVALVVALGLPSLAMAQPPTIGSSHTFLDPVFRGTIFCDTLEEVRAIATADLPDEIYANYYLTTNERDEPMCMAIAPTAEVTGVTALGVMVRDGLHYNAWAVETNVDGIVAYALYLEHFNYVSA